MKSRFNSILEYLLKEAGKKDRILFWSLCLSFFMVFWFSFPEKLFDDPCSTVIESRTGVLLGARIADDEQWRFPYSEDVPEKFEKSIITFEDKRFYSHAGFDLLSFGRAVTQNMRSMSVVSGGSTISMQVIRLSRKGKSRSIFEKFIEMLMAYRMELQYSKSEILAMYASNAPFGGNVVGLDAASWRYFGRSPSELSWAESATLAVLPNSPSLIFPGKNQEKLRKKRNRLLHALHEEGIISKEDLSLALEEPLPGKPHPLPQLAPHLLDRMFKEGHKGKRITTSLSLPLQNAVNQLVSVHQYRMLPNDIHNISVLVLDVETGEVLSYVGNTNPIPGHEAENAVDVITASRSTGSILKPFLYCCMLQDGEILPNSLVPDVPVHLGSYQPENFDRSFDGAVPASKALARSLNIPAVKMLQQYGTTRFHYMLKEMGMTTLEKPASHYGLALILGGAEGSLWDICGVYASMARTLNHYYDYNGRYDQNDFHLPVLFARDNRYVKKGKLRQSLLNAAPIYYTFKAMVEVNRPGMEKNWKRFSSSFPVAWKTGTSYGYRDAWAVGLTTKYVVGVWVGNADGEGRPGLTGLTAAAPLLFETFKLLKPEGWFPVPYDDMQQIGVCRKSGFPASTICSQVDTLWIPATCVNMEHCPYHKIVHLDQNEMFQVSSECEAVSNMKHVSWFVLPPVMEHYYTKHNPFYRKLPPYRPDCQPDNDLPSMELIYPRNNTEIYIPLEMDGSRGKSVFRAAHRDTEAEIFWYIDKDFVGKTKTFHSIGVSPGTGVHTLTLVDSKGESIKRKFIILDESEEDNP